MTPAPLQPCTPAVRSSLGQLHHPGLIAAVALVALLLSYLIAVQTSVPAWELRMTEWINDVPDGVAWVSYPVMQFGTLAGPLVVGVAIVLFRRDLILGCGVVVTGVLTWFGAKGVKRLVDRSRPLEFIPDIVVREGDGGGLGYISGHSAVAAATATMAAAVLAPSVRPVVVAGAVVVGLARVAHGVHLPADIIGGWSFGVLVGLAGLAAVDAVHVRTVRRRCRAEVPR